MRVDLRTTTARDRAIRLFVAALAMAVIELIVFYRWRNWLFLVQGAHWWLLVSAAYHWGRHRATAPEGAGERNGHG